MYVKHGLVATLFFVGLTTNELSAKDAPGTAPPDPAVAIEELAQKVFTSADRNHNHFLSRNEYQVAEHMLETTVNEWGRSGLIGKPKKNNKNAKQEAALSTAASDVSGNKLSRSNKISQAEFTFHVHAYVEDADNHWREQNAAMAAQLKMLDAQRKAMRSSRMRGRYPVYPVPY